MKLNIQKLQSGGGFGMLFSAVADPSSNAAKQQAAGTSSSKNEDSGILSKEVLNKLRENGLPNEVDVFEDVLAQLDQKIASGKPISPREISEVRKMANRIIKQSDYLDKAIDFADKNESLNDVAVDSNGYIYAVGDSGKVEKIRFDKFNINKYQALTYGELAEYRRNSPDLINNSDIIKSIGNSIGIEKINKFIQDILDKVGESENKTEAYAMLKTILPNGPRQMSQQDYDALIALSQASGQIGLDTLFKTSELNKNSNVAIAAQYIMSIMPKNMKAQLQGQYISSGGNANDSESYALNLIQLAATAAGNHTHYYSIDYDGQLNTQAGNTTTKGQTQNLTMLENMVYGTRNQVTWPLTSEKAPQTTMILHGSNNPLGDNKNQIVKPGPLGTILENEAIGQLVDPQHIYIGSQKINPALLESVLYTGDNGVLTTWFPTDGNGNINWGLAAKFNAIMERCKSDASLTQSDKQSMLQEAGISGTIDADGTFHSSDPNMEQFYVVNGITSKDVLGKEASSNLYTNKLRNDDKSAALRLIERLYANANHGKAKDGKVEFQKGFMGWDWTTSLYQAPIIMRAQKQAQNNVGTIVQHGPTFQTPTYQQSILQQEARNPQIYSSDLL